MQLLSALLVASACFAKPQVMILGTYHFANPGLDAVKVQQEDILTPKRQREVESLVAGLARFKPTKILVEVVPERQSELDESFREFSTKGAALSKSETQQVGFRLAKQFRLAGVVAVDYKSEMDFNKVMGFAMQNGMAEVPQRMGGLIQKLGSLFGEWDSKYTVGQIIAIHNTPIFVRRSQQLYTDMLAVGKHPNYPGADLLAGWYRRNLVIYDNIRRHLKPDDRAIVIYGSGHSYYLSQLLKDDVNVQVVEAGAYLPKSPITTFPDLN